MSELIDPETIGRSRLAREVKQGWHVEGLLALHDAYVGSGFVLIDVRTSDGQTKPLEFRHGQYAATRTPAEQVQYIEACHRQLVAQAGVEKRTVSGQPVPPCTRPECAAVREELAQLRARRAPVQRAAMHAAPVVPARPRRTAVAR